MRSLIEIDIKRSKAKHNMICSTWIFYVNIDPEIAIDLMTYNESKISINLVSLDRLNVVTMNGVWELTFLVDCNVNSRWLILLVLISKELSINLNMNYREFVGVFTIEIHRVSSLNFVLWWRLPVLILWETDLKSFKNLCLNHELLGVKRSVA